jgi:hypothetical protein
MARRGVILGLDDSPGALAALRWAATYARRSRLRLSAVHVSSFLADPPADWSPENAPPEHRSGLGLGPMADRARTMFASIDPDPEWGMYFLGGAPGRTLSTSRVIRRCSPWVPENTPASAACWLDR